MSGFYEIADYHGWLNLLLGFLWFGGLYQIGSWLLVSREGDALWVRQGRPLLGMLVLSLLVQMAGSIGGATVELLLGLSVLILATGAVAVIRRVGVVGGLAIGRNEMWGFALVIPAAVLILLAMGPATKADEIYYHMLLPARVLVDGELQFYRMPVEAAPLPQMLYQLSLTPLHALGRPNAGNVVSVCFYLHFVGLVWLWMRREGLTSMVATAATLPLLVGLHGAVWYTTSGGHAVGDTALAAAVALYPWVWKEPQRYGARLNLLLVAAVGAKVSVLPVVGLLGLGYLIRLLITTGRDGWARGLGAGLWPWLLWVPILGLTWRWSGSPLGPFGAGSLGPSVYDVEWLRALLERIRLENQYPWLQAAKLVVGYYPALLLLGTGFSVLLVRRGAVWGWLAFTLGVQLVAIALLLPRDLRFLGGLHLGLYVLALPAMGRWAVNALTQLLPGRSARWAVGAAWAMLVLPWFGLLGFYSIRLLPAAVSGEAAQRQVEAFTPLYQDWQALDAVLPEKAYLLAEEFRLSAFYAPRPVFIHRSDLPHDGLPVYRLLRGEEASARAAEAEYFNPQAVMQAFRTPGRPPVRGPLAIVAEEPPEEP